MIRLIFKKNVSFWRSGITCELMMCIFIQFMHYNLRTKQKRPETHHLDAEPFYLKLNDAGS